MKIGNPLKLTLGLEVLIFLLLALIDLRAVAFAALALAIFSAIFYYWAIKWETISDDENKHGN